MKVKDCMCNDVYSVSPNTNIHEVAKLMSENHIGCVPVCEDSQQICGIITDRDIVLRAVATGKNLAQTMPPKIFGGNASA